MTTSANVSSASADRLARRYGTRPAPRPGRDAGDGSDSRPGLGRRAAWLGSAAVAVVITAIVVLLNVTGDDAVATAQVVSYEVTGPEETVVQLAVTRPDPSVAVTCSVEAIDASLAQVGARVVEVPAAGSRTTTLTVEIATYARAEQGRALENGCFAASD
ncbi:DUF4307 domain-containing protein [Salana multivorans]